MLRTETGNTHFIAIPAEQYEAFTKGNDGGVIALFVAVSTPHVREELNTHRQSAWLAVEGGERQGMADPNSRAIAH